MLLVAVGVFSFLNLSLVNCDLITSILNKSGYAAEIHNFVTKDGYVLTLHRIPPKNVTKRPEAVILMHGIIGSSGDFILAGKHLSLGNILHDEGYDVWLPNARGNTWSRQHRNLSWDSPEFWDFSWHEMGQYDLPAIIDGVTSLTGVKKVHYVAHSQGCTAFFVLLCQLPEYNNKIASAHLLSPIAFMADFRSPLARLMAQDLDELQVGQKNTEKMIEVITQYLQKTIRRQHLWDLMGYNPMLQTWYKVICGAGSPTQEFCLKMVYSTVGFSDFNIDRKLFGKIFITTPAGMSSKQAVHFGQLILSGDFQQFDYQTKDRNMQIYKSPKPPKYNLRNVNISLNMFYGDKDLLLSVKDVERLKMNLDHTSSKFYGIRGFNHIDFLYSNFAHKLVYRKILSIMRHQTINE